MIKEVTNSFKAALYQRVSSPLYGTYIFSWMLYNWKSLLPLLLGSKNIDERLRIFTASLNDTDGSFNYFTIIVPILMAALILLLQPVLQRFIFIYSEWNKSAGLKKRDEYNRETMLTLEQSNELRASVHKMHAFHQETIKNNEAEMAVLNNTAASKEKEFQTLSEQGSASILENLKLTNELSNNAEELVSVQSSLQTSIESYEKSLKSKDVELAELNTSYLAVGKTNDGLLDIIHENDKGVQASIAFIEQMTSLINLKETYRHISQENIEQMMDVSGELAWKDACYHLLIEGFKGSTSFQMSDDYFDKFIRPNIASFDEDLLKSLLSGMRSNIQISERNRAEKDLAFVLAASLVAVG